MVKNAAKKSIAMIQRGWYKLSITVGLMFMLILSQPVSAGALAGTQLVTGLRNLMNDAQKVVLIFGPIAAVVLCGYFFIRLQGADEMDQKKWSNRIKIAVVGLIGCLVAAGLLGVIGSYFSG
ncbi:MAG: hypothetical protein RR385_07440 [Clostridiales bacterium]